MVRVDLCLALAVAVALGCVNGRDPEGGLIEEWGDDEPNPPPVPCDVVEQTRCAAGEKCTWQQVTDTLGRITCAPDGEVPPGGRCSTLPPGETAGYDDCIAGSFCIGGVCEEICVDDPDSCSSPTTTCTVYPGLFEGAFVETGVCHDTCEPGPQTRISDGAPDCGGIDDAPRGCYGTAWGATPTGFACMPDTSAARHGEPPDPLNPQGNPHPYSCDAGYFPWAASLAPDAPAICVAFCTPGETHSAAPENSGGVAPFPCSARGAAAPGTECRYLHLLDETAPRDEHNGSGVCVDPDEYVADWDHDPATPASPLPRCVDLGTGLIDTDGDGTPDTAEHQKWGCAPWSD